MKIKKDDKIKVLSGKDAGKTGKVVQVFPEKNRASVEGINLLYKNLRARKQGETGQRIQFPAPLDISNIALICPKCTKPTRVGYKIVDGKKTARVCRKCKQEF